MLGTPPAPSSAAWAAQALPEHMLAGRSQPLGALARDGGVNFSVFSEHAQRLWVCVFDPQGQHELRRYALHGPRDGVWHGFLPGTGPGLVYGLRADGPYAPHEGHRFNPHKLLLDPWARDIVGSFTWRDEHHGYTVGHPDGPRSFDSRDNAPWALKARVAPAPIAAPGWHNAPRHDRADVVLYEVHVKSFSQRHPGIPSTLRGTYAALAHPAAIEHFLQLGVTTLSLLPVHYRLSEAFLEPLGLVNHWGYNTLGFFCPDPRLARRDEAAQGAQREFQEMVHTLHEHGLEVVLDVVYNHTAEGNEWGPTLSFRGLDHRSWYRLESQDASACVNYSGCGNTLNITHPRVLQWVTDSLRYWVFEMGVDGFRFDLAAVLGRTHPHFDSRSAFFAALAQDPVLSQARWIAEAWDSGPQGYQVGQFPRGWLEWNDRFRDVVRRYWLWPTQVAAGLSPSDNPHLASPSLSRVAQAGPISRGEFARRFCASSDLFHHSGRHPTASVNFISAHDGFTLADFTQYHHKHNHANGEHNQDGRDDELSAEVSDPLIRQRVRRALLATLALAQGTPMVLSGDEIGHSQGGNNNAWSQDSEVSWLNWSARDTDMQELLSHALALRRHEPALRHDRWFDHRAHGTADHALSWITPEGHVMQSAHWEDLAHLAFACHICTGTGVQAAGDEAALRRGSAELLLAFNPHAQPVDFALPVPSGSTLSGRALWRIALDTSGSLSRDTHVASSCSIPAHSLVVLAY